MANAKTLIGLMLITAAALMACGGDAGGGAANVGPQPVTRSTDAVPVVSLAMDDYLGSTVVLYFSFPG
ncbi:MAG: hypothetical protein IH963_00715 [Chloroflexi bacterium]|nr:hypothetical protein [Chloroflexota bacterium]